MSKESGNCKDCKLWREQGPRTKSLDFEPTVVGWCKRLPHTEEKDQNDWCGEFETKTKRRPTNEEGECDKCAYLKKCQEHSNWSPTWSKECDSFGKKK